MGDKIEFIKAREVLDSRGFPTIEVEISLKSGIIIRAISPAGTSTGKYEACELRDGNKNWYEGKGVSKAVQNVNCEIRSALIGKHICEQEEIDYTLCKLDNTPDKSRLGANAIVAVSYCVAKACAKTLDIPLYQYLLGNNLINLPMPWIVIMNGGAHTGGTVDFQELLVAPVCAKSYKECFYIAWKIHKTAWKILSDRYNYRLVFALSGGLAPVLNSNEEAISILVEAIQKAGYKPGIDVLIYVDVAASSFFNNNYYYLSSEKKQLTSLEMTKYLSYLIQKYPIRVIEDGFDQDDWDGWSMLTEKIGSKVDLVGDDLFVTNANRLTTGIKKGIANAVLIKVNQIGTITEALKTVNIAKRNNYKTIISTRSRKPAEEPILPHLAIGFGVDEGKFGGTVEAICIQNEFIRIEENLKSMKKDFNYLWKKQ